MLKTPVIAFVAWQAISVVEPAYNRPFGGLETSAWSFAKLVAATQRYRPTLIVRSPARKAPLSIDGVNMFFFFDPFSDYRRRFSDLKSKKSSDRSFAETLEFASKLAVLSATWAFRKRDPKPMEADWRLMDLQPDIWIGMGANRDSAGCVATAIAQKKPSIIMIRSNMDVDPRLNDPGFVTEYGERAEWCKFALMNASAIMCQSTVQQQMVKTNFGRDSFLVRNPLKMDQWLSTKPECDQLQRNGVLWVGRFDDFHKRIQHAIAIAQRLPNIPFRFIAQPFSEEVERKVRANLPANVELVNAVPFEEMASEYRRCKLLLMTGSAEYEGMPNVMLQATATRTPIVSLQDFDGFLQDSKAGVVCFDDIEFAIDQLKSIYNEQTSIDHEFAQTYLKCHYSTPAVTSALMDVLNSVWKDG